MLDDLIHQEFDDDDFEQAADVDDDDYSDLLDKAAGMEIAALNSWVADYFGHNATDAPGGATETTAPVVQDRFIKKFFRKVKRTIKKVSNAVKRVVTNVGRGIRRLGGHIGSGVNWLIRNVSKAGI